MGFLLLQSASVTTTEKLSTLFFTSLCLIPPD